MLPDVLLGLGARAANEHDAGDVAHARDAVVDVLGLRRARARGGGVTYPTAVGWKGLPGYVLAEAR